MLVLLQICLFCYVMREASYCLFLRHQADVIETFNSTSRYLYNLLNTDNTYFKQMVGHIYPTELQSITNDIVSSESYDKQAYLNSEIVNFPFLDGDVRRSLTNDIVSSESYDKQDYLNSEIVNFPFLDGDVRRSLPMVYIFCTLCVL